jgi:5-methylcytosine-specific restriction endonuclease McrA
VNDKQRASQKKYRETHKEKIKAYQDSIKDRKSILNHENYLINKEKVNKRSKEYAQNIRSIVLEHYGNKCACCGETRKEFLSIDHINNDGNKQRIIAGGGGFTFQCWIVKNNFPDDLQILCHNCNLAKGFYGYCPHSFERSLP